jgi:quinone-modifying oxidoreductase, subunit QmoA
MTNSNARPLLVVGAGIAGVTAALEAAEAGRKVVLVEQGPSIGGRVLRNHQYFPKLCPPSCGMEINVKRIERNPRVSVKTSTDIIGATEGDDGWTVKLATAAKHVNARCTLCGECSDVCPAKVPDPFNLGMSEVPAIRLPHQDAWPRLFTLDREACPADCKACADACKYEAIDLDAEPTEETLEAGAVILATGWRPYDLENLNELGGDNLQDVVSNVNMERLAAPAGPTGGKVLRPSTEGAPKSIAFVQCAGSRDIKHLNYCSGVCCLASMKQAMYVKEQLPETDVTIYYIDRRAPGRNESVLAKVNELDGVRLVKGKVGRIEAADGALVLKVEDTESGTLLDAKAEMVVLATGMVPNLKDGALAFEAKLDEDGFGLDDPSRKLFVAGVARRPEDVASSVRDATGSTAKALIAMAGGN